jgi:CSLREA domain-containing protein
MKITTHKAAQGRGKSMFLRHSFLRQFSLRQLVTAAVFPAFMLLSPSSFGTTYEITSTDDVVSDDGVCTLREAIAAVNSRVVVDTCPAGSDRDRIQLVEGESYILDTELVVGGGMTAGATSTNINPILTIDVIPLDPFDDEIKENPTLFAADSARIFNVLSGAGLIINNVTLDGAVSGSGPTDGFGGLIRAESGVQLGRKAVLKNGQATFDGGAIYLATDNASLSIEDAAFLSNSAGGNGGAIATLPSHAGLIVAATLYMEDNIAIGGGGAIFLDGAGTGLVVENATFYGNSAADGGAIRLQASERTFALNNVTIAGQEGGGGISFAVASAPEDVSDFIGNSVIVGNVGGSCLDDDAGGATVDAAFLAYVLNEGDECPNDQTGFVGVAETQNDEGSADFSVLAGLDSSDAKIDCPAGLGKAGCKPFNFEGHWGGFLPSLEDTIGASDGVPTALNSASPLGSTTNTCASLDQRGNGRADDCDAGSIELTAAQGAFDEFIVVEAKLTELNVIENDLGDTEIDCSLLPPLSLPGDCLIVMVPPTKGNYTVEMNADNVPVIMYRSYAGVHGVDRLTYRVPKEAIVGQLTYAGEDPGALANIVVEPQYGLLESDSIGSFSLFTLFVAVMLGVVRRVGARAAALAVLLMFGLSAQAATITVTSLVDEVLYDGSDGLCTLREAIANAFNPVTADCAFGDANGTDIIMLPEGVIVLQGTLNIPLASSIELIGTGAADQLPTSSIIDGAGSFRIFSAASALKMSDLVLRNGYTTGRGGAVFTSANLTLERVSLIDNHADQDGGAIFLSFNSELKRRLVITRSEFDGNSATLAGGAISMAGQNQKHELQIESASFIDNTAGSTGGAMDVNLPKGGDLRIANSTFYDNDAAIGGGALDLQNAIAAVYVMNSTFIDNGTYAIDLGDIDPEEVSVQMHNSVYFDASGSALCSSGTGAFRSESFNAFGMRPAQPSSCYEAPDVPATPVVSESDDYPESDLRSILDVTNPIPAGGEGDAFVPTHFAIDATDINAAYLLDAGKSIPADLVRGLDFPPSSCRESDTRSLPRSAGGRCDIGAYEAQLPTSVDDEGSNAKSVGGYAIMDVVENDVAGEGNFIVPYAIDLDHIDMNDLSVQTSMPTPGYSYLDSGAATVNRPGSVRLVGNTTLESLEEDCGWDVDLRPVGAFDACLVRYDPPAFDGPDRCNDIEDFTDTFTYAVIVNDDALIVDDEIEDFIGTSYKTVPATVTVSIKNLGPSAPNKTVVASPGDVVVFPFDVTDPENFAIEDDYELKQKPINAKFQLVDGKRVYLGTGIIVDPVGKKVTYYPDNVSSPFDERFSITYKDECGASGTTTFVIDYPHQGSSGDVLGGGGSMGLGGLLVMLLLGYRKHRV